MDRGKTQASTFCRFCGSFCGALIELDGDTVTQVRGDDANPASKGYLCPKGRSLGAWHHHPDRLDLPVVGSQPTNWAAALDDAGERLQHILDEHGPDAIGFFFGTAGMLDTLGFAAGGAFVQALGTASRYSTLTIDSPSVLLAAEAIAGHPMLLPGPDTDARFVLWFGGNPVVSHGHGYFLSTPTRQLRRWATRGQLWVVDPRRTETAGLATKHLPIRAGTDHALLAFLVRGLLQHGADYDYLDAHADGVEIVRDAVAPFTQKRTAAETGLAEEALDELLTEVRRAGRIAVKESTGITFQSNANVCVWLIWVLNIITNSHDRPGGTFFNPGHVRRLHEQTWQPMDGSPAPGPPSRPDLPSRWGEYPCTALSDEIEAGNVRALIVVGGNPITAIPQPRRLRSALRTLDLLIVSDVVPTPTTELATHLLPATGQLERADIWPIDFLHVAEANQYARAVVPPGGERRPTWWQLAQLAKRLDQSILPGHADPDSTTEEDMLRWMVQSNGADFDDLANAPHGVSTEPRHFGWVENVLPNGRWRLAPRQFVDQLAAVQVPRPGLRLISRRQRHHLNSQLSDGTGARSPDLARASINPIDAEERGIEEGDQIVVTTPYGSLAVTAHHDESIAHGTVSLPHGFADTNVGSLTSDCYDVDELTGLPVMTAIPIEIAQTDSGGGGTTGTAPTSTGPRRSTQTNLPKNDSAPEEDRQG